ncbi:Peptidylprolyl isomerase [Streptomyces xiamenensis]|uniref:Peptidyl-prolyl cis-trans isomerase n=1 Tax=Streptomyces xiamenensis TaxID=408015 RepID=A0A0F7FU60_9ACTN|nr:Peptidylprolyl isomerase [Streptomyces xiamenensis]
MNRTSRRLAAALLCLGLITACGSESGDEGSSDSQGQEQQGGQQEQDGQEEEQSDLGQDIPSSLAGPAGAEASQATSAVLHTSEGDITVTLFPEEAPLTVTNFAGLADGSLPWEGQQDGEPLYQDLIFHRVIDGFMIQGGDPQGTGMGGPGYQFDDEVDSGRTFDEPYLLAMANAGLNPDGSGTNGSQFFITVVPTEHLNGKHTIFGEVADEESRAVVDAIATTETAAQDRPVKDIVIESVTIGD